MFKFIFKPEKVYILPSRFGFLLLLTGITLLVIGLTYANNLIILNALGLLILSVFSSIITHFNLFGVTLISLTIVDTHADSPLKISGVLKNATKNFKKNICIVIKTHNKNTISVNHLDMNPLETRSFECFTDCLTRGKYEIKQISLNTSYPFGIFYSWLYPKTSLTSHDFYIYPKPQGEANLNNFRQNIEQDLHSGQIMDINEFLHHETYIPGTPYSRIDWKIHAKKDFLLTKKFSYEHIHNGYSIELDDKYKDLEKELMKISKMIGICHKYNLLWRLITPKLHTSYNNGNEHYHKCMKELAIYDE